MGDGQAGVGFRDDGCRRLFVLGPCLAYGFWRVCETVITIDNTGRGAVLQVHLTGSLGLSCSALQPSTRSAHKIGRSSSALPPGCYLPRRQLHDFCKGQLAREAFQARTRNRVLFCRSPEVATLRFAPGLLYLDVKCSFHLRHCLWGYLFIEVYEGTRPSRVLELLFLDVMYALGPNNFNPTITIIGLARRLHWWGPGVAGGTLHPCVHNLKRRGKQ
mmetsp:Transcript_14059/g.51080  ORF Transcript_14059/g.51080 Transcript_14059/m.51080 type:complete len:217 (-) Transcript_14059:1137-1787(-)